MDYSREVVCNNSQGGVEKVYLFPYVDYFDSDIIVENNILTYFPASVIYDMNAININYTIPSSEDSDITYTETVTFQIKKLLETDDFIKFINKDFRIIVKDNNGKLRVFGLKTGMVGNYTQDVGTNRVDFNGYSFTFTTKEEQSAPYLSNMDMFFVDNLPFIGDENGNFIGNENNEIIEVNL